MWLFRLKRAHVTLQYMKVCFEEIFMNYFPFVAENKRSE